MRLELPPLKLFAVTVPALKFPNPSRRTRVLGVFAAVAALTEVTVAATEDAVFPLIVETIVAPCVPVTSPINEPEKLAAVVAELAEVAVVAEVAQWSQKLHFPRKFQ